MKKIFIYILFIITSISFSSSPKWYIETVDNRTSGWWNSIKIDSSDNPHIAYYYENAALKYAYYDGNEWRKEVVDTDGIVGIFVSLALDSNDNPHISYAKSNDNKDYDLKYAYFDGKDWHISFVETEGDVGSYCSIAVDSKNRPHIAYYKEVDYYTGELKYAHFDNSQWKIETIESGGGIGEWTSIVIDDNDRPHISYGYTIDNSELALKYAYYDGTEWKKEVVDTEGGSTNSLALDSMNRPHISYYVGGYKMFLKYAFYDGSKWNYEVLDTLFSGMDNSIAVDKNDHPHIAYSYLKEYDDHDLKYAYFDGNNWNKITVESNGDTGEKASITLNSHDFPHISYLDGTYGTLKHAWYGYGLGIDLTSFSAKPNNDAITLNWSISTDEDISGFNLYRRIIAPFTVSTVRENSYSPTCSPATVGEIATFPLQTDDNAQWTKVNTSLITGTNPYSYTDRDITPDTNYEYKLEAVTQDNSETLGTTSVDSGRGTPESFNIVRIYPTPAYYKISIDVIIPEKADIDIAIYDIAGRRVATVASGQYSPGEYTLTSDITGLTNGVYIVRMTDDGFSSSKNFVVAK